MKLLKCFFTSLVLLTLTACDYTDFESTWRDPSLRRLDLRNKDVAAVLLSANESVRRSFEYNLAKQLNEHGIEASPGYELLSGADGTNKEAILADLQGTQGDYAILMRVVDRQKEVSYVPGSSLYPGYYNDPFLWSGGAYGGGPWGFGGPFGSYYDPGYYRVDTIVSVETLIYSVPESKLLWAGLSKTMNPSHVDDFVEDLVDAAFKEMGKKGLLFS